MPPASDDRASLVLLIERDPSVRDLFRTALTGAGGFAVIPARDDADAVRRLAVSTPDVVVVALASTRDGGRYLLSAMDMQRLQQVPVIAISDQPVATAAETGFACVLLTPVDLDDLVAAILSCLEDRKRQMVGAGAERAASGPEAPGKDG